MENGTTGRWLDVNAAAEELGVSTDAVRKRVARGSLRSERTDAGVRVWLDHGGTTAGREAHGEAPALVEVLTEQAAYLRGQLAEEREARRRADTIIAQLTQANAALSSRVPELEPPTRSPAEWAADEEAAREDAGMSTRPDAQRQSWWRRVFGG